MLFTSISYLLFLPLIVLAYYLIPAMTSAAVRTSPADLTPPPPPPQNREGSACTRNDRGNSYQWICLVLASVVYYLSFIPVFFALIGVLVIGNYFTDKQAHKEKDVLSDKSTHLTLNHLILNTYFLTLSIGFTASIPSTG